MEKVHNLNIIRRRRIELNRGKRIERRCARQGQMASKSSQESQKAVGLKCLIPLFIC